MKLSVQNSLRTPVKVRRLNPDQLGIPSGGQEKQDDEDRLESLQKIAKEAAKEAGVGAAVRTDDGTVSSGSRLSKGSSHEVHALELAVWKGFDKTRSPVIEVALSSEDADELPCGRCLGVLSDYSSDAEVSIWITGGDNTEEYSLSELLQVRLSESE